MICNLLNIVSILINPLGAEDKIISDSQHIQAADKKKIHIIVKNRNTKDLNLLIKPEIQKPTYNYVDDHERVGWLILTIPAALDDSTGIDAEFSVTAEQLGDFNYYSITGETNPLTPTGTCYNLQMGKTYQIEFTNNLFGTSCVGIEQTDVPSHDPDSLRILPASKVMPTHRTGASRIPDRPSEGLTPHKKN